MARTIAELKKKKIGVLMGGVSEEREISLKTGRSVASTLRSAGYRVSSIDAGADLATRLRRSRIDVAFIALHGRLGEDGCVQGLLEVMGIPYTGSKVLSSALCMDKAEAKKILAFHGIKTPRWRIVERREEADGLGLPLVIKPVSGGSAIGASIVKNRAAIGRAIARAGRSGRRVMAEGFISGRELTVGVLDSVALPVVEILPKRGFYDFAAKYTKGGCEFEVPARLTPAQEKRVTDSALASCAALGCTGAARVDVILSGRGAAYVIEVNTIPGMTGLSLLPMAAEAAGIDYLSLIERILLGAGCAGGAGQGGAIN